MPQMLVTQPVVPQAPSKSTQLGSPGNKEQSQFSPHLENAISNNKPTQQAKRDESNNRASAASDENILTDGISQDTGPTPENHKDFNALATTEDSAAILQENPEPISLGPLYAKSTRPTTSGVFSKSQQGESPKNLLRNSSVAIGNEPDKSISSPNSYSIQPEPPPTGTEPAVANPTSLVPLYVESKQPTTSGVFSKSQQGESQTSLLQDSSVASSNEPDKSSSSPRSSSVQPALPPAGTEPAVTNPTSLAPLYVEATRPTTSSVFSKSQQGESPTSLLQNSLVEIGNEPNKSSSSPRSYLIQPALPPEGTEPAVVNPTKPVASTRQDSLISQLQHIIDNANETGTVSITKAGNTSTPHSITGNIHAVMTAPSSGISELGQNGLAVTDVAGIDKAAGKPAQQLTGIRHDNQQHYFNAKVNTQNLADNNQNSQGNQQGDELSQQSTSSSQANGPLAVTEQTSTFSQISAIVPETTTQHTNEVAKPIILPSGAIVHEEEIIQQLAQRFQVSSKQMDSRINLKLHPAELGELKIDLTVKEGSIRANVVAQSQNTLEILEKNIPKLKSMLESQGFTVAEISVTAESDSVGDFDLFEQQLFGNNDYTPTAQKKRQEDEDIFTLDNSEFVAPAMSTGVNVKI